jgi:hypothetical protein
MDHLVGARFAPPPVLYGAFEPNEERYSVQQSVALALRDTWARVFVELAQGGSVRCAAPA